MNEKKGGWLSIIITAIAAYILAEVSRKLYAPIMIVCAYAANKYSDQIDKAASWIKEKSKLAWSGIKNLFKRPREVVYG